MTPTFFFSGYSIFWLNYDVLILVGLCTMVMLCGCHIMVVVSEVFLIYGNFVLFVAYVAGAVMGLVGKHFLLKLCEYPFCWKMLYT